MIVFISLKSLLWLPNYLLVSFYFLFRMLLNKKKKKNLFKYRPISILVAVISNSLIMYLKGVLILY